MPTVFRIDSFVVPAEVLPTFVERVHRTQRALDALPGCRQNLVLSQTGGSGECNVVTVVEWDDARAMAAARGAMHLAYAEQGFDPAAFMHQLGVRADLGLYAAA